MKKTYKIGIGIGSVLLLIGIVSVFSRNDAPKEVSSVSVIRKDIVQSVSETGSVDAETEIVYGFESSGRVVSVDKKVGDTVKKGDIIARIDSALQRARLSEAVSLRAAAQARVQLEYAGPTDEDKRKLSIAIDQAKAALQQTQAEQQKTISESTQAVVTAEKALDDAKNNLRLAEGGNQSQLVIDAYEDAVNTLKIVMGRVSDGLAQADAILGIDNQFANDGIEIAIGFRDKQSVQTATYAYTKAKQSFRLAADMIYPLNTMSSQQTIDQALLYALTAVSDVQSVLFSMQLVLNASNPVGDLSQTELDTFISSINASLANVNAASASLSNDKQAILSAKNSLSTFTIAYEQALSDVRRAEEQAQATIAIAEARVLAQQAALAAAQANYDASVAPPRSVDVASLQADVARYNANVAALQHDVNKTNLIALGDGVISVLDSTPGENVSALESIVTIISPQLSIDVDISESDISKVRVGDTAQITFDAFSDNDIVEGTVVRIEPAETEVSGVIYYKTDIIFSTTTVVNDIRPGMTANITIVTDQKEAVLVIPQRAILTKDDGTHVVRVLTDKKKFRYEERPITLGLRGNNGEIEVISGLQEQEEVITFLKE